MHVQFHILSFVCLLKLPLQALPPECLKGLCDDAMVDERAELFSPVYGFLALETGTLERIRFFGKFGKIYQTRRDEWGMIVKPEPEDLVDPSVPDPGWIHPIFAIKDLATVEPENREMEISKNFTRQFEHPLDPICALVQWLFPSVDGENLVSNYYGDSDHPVKEMFKRRNSTAAFLSSIYGETFTKPDLISNPKDKFLTIAYEALRQDGTLSHAPHDPLYPKNIALHALLGYLWQHKSKDQMTDVLTHAGLMKKPWGNERYTESDYQEIRDRIKSRGEVSFKEKAYAGYAYEIYDALYPNKISYGRSNEGTPLPLYMDCGETMLRNFFNVVAYARGGRFRQGMFSGALGQFYRAYPDMTAQKTIGARNSWSAVVSGLPGVRYFKETYEIDSGDLGIINILNVVAALTGDEILRYDRRCDLQEKMNRLCTIFSRDRFLLGWLQKSDQDFVFTINGTNIFSWIIKKRHFDFKIYTKNIEDWRKNPWRRGYDLRVYPYFRKNEEEEWKKDLSENFLSFLEKIAYSLERYEKFLDHYLLRIELLSPFYTEDLSGFLDPLIRENIIKPFNNLSKRVSDRSMLTILYLRFLYKAFGDKIEDENAQDKIARGLGFLDSSSFFVKDFVQNVVVEKLNNDSIGKTLFEGEFLGNIHAYDTQNNQEILDQALKWEFVEASKTLIQSVDISTPRNILHLCAKKGNLEVAQCLISGKVDLNDVIDLSAVNDNGDIVFLSGYAPLHVAVKYKQTAMMDFLIKSGANINQTTLMELTPLMIAVENEDLKTTEELLKIQNIHIDAQYWTPLMEATNKGNIDIIKALLKAGADANRGALYIATLYAFSDRICLAIIKDFFESERSQLNSFFVLRYYAAMNQLKNKKIRTKYETIVTLFFHSPKINVH